MSSFADATIDYKFEYTEARKLMGTIGTDMDLLFDSVTLLYLNCPEDLQDVYIALIHEITDRQHMLAKSYVLRRIEG